MPTRFTLIRHGQTDWNVQGKWQGHAYIGLNAEGHRQAQLLATGLAGDDAGVIFSSDLPRARQTADYVAATLQIPLILDARLREIDVGDWQGLTIDEVDEWDAARHLAIRAAGYHAPRPNGESQAEVGARMLDFIDEIQRTRHENHVYCVTHGGTIRITLIALGLLPDDRNHIDNTSRTRLAHEPTANQWAVEYFNLLSHLRTPITATGSER